MRRSGAVAAFIRAACVLVVCVSAAAEQTRLVPLFRQSGVNYNVGYSNVLTVDIDGDSRPEIVGCTEGAPFAISARNGTYVKTWQGSTLGCAGVAAGDRNGDGGAEVITVSGQTVRIFDPRSLAGPVATVTFTDTAFARDVVLGNVDADAKDEIVFRSEGDVMTLHGDTFATSSWSHPSVGVLAVADADDNGVNEVIVGTSSYPYRIEGYSTSGVAIWANMVPRSGTTAIAVADLGADGTPELIAATNNFLFVSYPNHSDGEWRGPGGYAGYYSAAGDLGRAAHRCRYARQRAPLPAGGRFVSGRGAGARQPRPHLAGRDRRDRRRPQRPDHEHHHLFHHRVARLFLRDAR